MAAETKTEHYYSAHNVATRVNFGKWTSVHESNHYDVDTIFVGLSWELHRRWQLDRALERWRHNYYTFVSLHGSDHEGVVRIFVALSCELGGFFIYINYLYYAEQFSPTRSVISPKTILQSTARPHQSTARPLERAASHIKVTRPPCLFVAAMRKCKQINNSNSPYVSDVIINYSWEKLRDFVDAVFPTLSQ